MKIKKDDNILVIAGKDKGKKGKVRFVNPKNGKVTVESVNMVKKAARPTGQARQAGIIEREEEFSASNVMLICSKCNKATRVGYQYLEAGNKVRVCRACNEVID